jgi:hypothetical protein
MLALYNALYIVFYDLVSSLDLFLRQGLKALRLELRLRWGFRFLSLVFPDDLNLLFLKT